MSSFLGVRPKAWKRMQGRLGGVQKDVAPGIKRCCRLWSSLIPDKGQTPAETFRRLASLA